MRQRALFLDRDGTLVHPRHYPRRPEELRLYEGIGVALAGLQARGWQLVVITNQAGLARGLFTEDDLAQMHAHLAQTLGRDGVRLDGVYYCPHHPDGAVPQLAVRCDCRKPAPGLLQRAAAELSLDLASSWFVGDILDDVEAGLRAGCRTILVDLGTERAPTQPLRQPSYVARDTLHALAIVAAVDHAGPPVELDYRPAGWTAPEMVGVGAGDDDR